MFYFYSFKLSFFIKLAYFKYLFKLWLLIKDESKNMTYAILFNLILLLKSDYNQRETSVLYILQTFKFLANKIIAAETCDLRYYWFIRSTLLINLSNIGIITISKIITVILLLFILIIYWWLLVLSELWGNYFIYRTIYLCLILYHHLRTLTWGFVTHRLVLIPTLGAIVLENINIVTFGLIKLKLNTK